jgi:hypothetical protein
VTARHVAHSPFAAMVTTRLFAVRLLLLGMPNAAAVLL